MKKILFIALSFSILSISANAQQRRIVDSSQKVQSHFKNKKGNGDVMKEINLSAGQQEKLKTLHQESKLQRDAIKNNADLSPEQKKTQMLELRKSQKEQTNEILTAAQQAKLKSLKASRKGNQKKGKGNQHLNFSPDQKVKMNEIRKAFKQETDEIKNNPNLSSVQKKEKLKEIRRKQQQQMKQILTPEQKAKIKSGKERKRKN